MVSPIRWFDGDPDGIRRGRGYYYYRYGKKGILSKRWGKRIHWAKYDIIRDRNRLSKTKVKSFNPNYPHIGDGTYRGKRYISHVLNKIKRA